MSQASSYSSVSDRDAQVVAAMRRAIHSMGLIDGLIIHLDGMTGHVSFGHEIRRLSEAIMLMGEDPNKTLGETGF